jgi:hypothetical protein
MIYFVIISFILICCSAVGIIFVAKQNLQLNDKHEELVDQLEESLDILDECYARITRASDMEVLSDEPIVREVMSSIRHAKHAVLMIANKIVIYDEPSAKKE